MAWQKIVRKAMGDTPHCIYFDISYNLSGALSSRLSKIDMSKKTILHTLLFICLLFVSPLSADENTLVFRENFETPPNAFVKLVDGKIGKAGQFDGRSSFTHLQINTKSDWYSIELYFNSADGETSGREPASWRPLVHPGTWIAGDAQLILREGQASAHIHNGGAERLALYAGRLKNNTWYKLRLVMDAEKNEATLFLDDRRVDSGKLSPGIHHFTVRAPSFGSEHQNKFFNGLLDEITVTLKPFQDIETNDSRNIAQGIRIPHHGLYADQPLIVITPTGNWVCCLTVAPGGEGSRGQHVVAIRSTDGGKTWGDVIDIESTAVGGNYVTPLLTPSGRIYAFYSPSARMEPPPKRDDVQGYFCYKYSDDEGQTWSRRYWLPIRDSAWDLQREALRANKPMWCWAIAKPIIDGNDVFLPFSITDGIDGNGAGWIVHSNNILTERNPNNIHWDILPEGREGIRNPAFAPTQEEHIILPMNEKDAFVCVYRTRLGFPAISYSRDRCRTWSLPEKMTYADGRMISHPRACPMIWKCENGKYLFWGHNNSSKSFGNRNPVWISGGIERNGKIYWSQPEILLYADDTGRGMSYPDLVEYRGEYWISQTDKEIPRIHKIDNDFLEGIWQRLENDLDGILTPYSKRGLVLETSERTIAFPGEAAEITKTGGLTLDFELNTRRLVRGTVLLDNRTASGDGLAVIVDDNRALRFEMTGMDSRGRHQHISWRSDNDQLIGRLQRFSIVVDDNPKVIMFYTDGSINDGGGLRDLGWGRYWHAPNNLMGTGTLKLHPAINTLRIYSRFLCAYEL